MVDKPLPTVYEFKRPSEEILGMVIQCLITDDHQYKTKTIGLIADKLEDMGKGNYVTAIRENGVGLPTILEWFGLSYCPGEHTGYRTCTLCGGAKYTYIVPLVTTKEWDGYSIAERNRVQEQKERTELARLKAKYEPTKEKK